ncbi:hypothetical protein F4818DRAFT_446766 [Hypoxylon cercidicola]|nr:hypothetical protein F4818DRAFT_446766 [Hypoxylon cercidicola]
MPIQDGSSLEPTGRMELETQSSSTPTSIANSEPIKLSIRVIDGYADNREEDLEDGPLLRALGSTLTIDEANYQLHLDPDILTHSSSHTTGPQSQVSPTSGLPLVRGPLITAYTETSMPSESSSGRSFSEPTDSASYVGSRNNHYLDTHLLAGMQPIPEPTSETCSAKVLDIDLSKGDKAKAGPSHNHQPLFPWKFEFYWESDLTFAGDRLEADKRLKLPSSNSAMGLCVSVDGSDRSTVNAPVSLTDSVQPRMAGSYRVDLNDDEISSMFSDIYCRFMSILDDRYWRRRGPQRTTDTGSKARQDGEKNRSSNPYSRNMLQGSRSRPQRSRRGNINGSENNGDDDEDDSGNDEWARTPPAGPQGDSRRVDCPFYKRRPAQFPECSGLGHVKISHLKQHLKAKHRPPHCEICLSTLNPNHPVQHMCDSRVRPKEVMFIADDSFALIQRRPKTKGLENQWLEIYKALFPDDETPYPSPYVHDRVHVYANDIEAFLKENLFEVWQETKPYFSPDALAFLESQKGALNKAIKMWISRTMHRYRSQQASYDNEANSEAINLPTSDVPENSLSYDDISQPWGCHQLTETGSSSLQHGYGSSSDMHIGFQPDMFDGAWIHTSDQTTNLKDTEILPSVDPFEIDIPNNMSGIDESFMAYPAVDPLFLQQPSFGTYSEPWSPGARLNAESHTSSSFFNENSETNYVQPALLSLSNPFPNANEFLSGNFTSPTEQAVDYSNF